MPIFVSVGGQKLKTTGDGTLIVTPTTETHIQIEAPWIST